MSYRDPGTIAVVPPPLPRRRPILVYFAAALAVLALVLMITGGLYLGKMASALKAPLDKKVVLAAMKGLPVIDDAQYDELQTKIQTRVILPGIKGNYPSDTASVVAYKSFSYPDFIVAWYDKYMQGNGYTIHNETDETTAPAATFQHRYDKVNEVVLVQAQRAPNKDDSSLVVIRFTGYKGKE